MRKFFNTGVTVGKFSPPHRGHAHLIISAAQQVETLYILLCHKAGQLDPKLRVAWLQEQSPANCTYIITDDDLPEAPEPWAKRALELINTPIDVAFTSEEYGESWAQLMSAQHVCVDLNRSIVPISATAIRKNLTENYSYLVPGARAALCKRLVLAGPESSGKTTLSMGLAEALGTVWVPEYGRMYCEGRGLEREWDASEFFHIASMQTQMIEAMARHSDHCVLVSDTDALVTRVWQRRYLPDSDLLKPETSADHYFVCEPVEWEQDGTRESQQFREGMLDDTVQQIEASKTPYTMLSGSHEQRLQKALQVIREQVVVGQFEY